MRDICYKNNNNIIYCFSHEDLENICLDMKVFESDINENILMIPYNVEFNGGDLLRVSQENQKLSISKTAFINMVRMIQPNLYQKYKLLLQEV